MGYTITFHKSTADASTNNYDEITNSTVDALSGHTSLECKVRIAGGIPYRPEDEQITYLGGEKSSMLQFRRVWEMTFLTASHRASSTNSISNLTDFIQFVTDSAKPYLWMDMSAYSTASSRAETWHTAGKYIPIVIDDWSTSINEKEGTETLTATISHRWRNL